MLRLTHPTSMFLRNSLLCFVSLCIVATVEGTSGQPSARPRRLPIGFVSLETYEHVPGGKDERRQGLILQFNGPHRREVFARSDANAVLFVPLRVGRYCVVPFDDDGNQLKFMHDAPCFTVHAGETESGSVVILPTR